MAFYRRFTSAWDRDGWSPRPQFPAQKPRKRDRDFPAACPRCGGRLQTVGPGWWMAARHHGRAPRTGEHVALCEHNHVVRQRPVSELLELAAGGNPG